MSDANQDPEIPASAFALVEVSYPSGWNTRVPARGIGTGVGPDGIRPMVEVGEDTTIRGLSGKDVSLLAGDILVLDDPRAVIEDVQTGQVLYSPREVPLDEHPRWMRNWLSANPRWAS